MKKLTKEEKYSFIVKWELKIREAISKGHKCNDEDEFQEVREIIEKYRIQLGLIKSPKK